MKRPVSDRWVVRYVSVAEMLDGSDLRVPNRTDTVFVDENADMVVGEHEGWKLIGMGPTWIIGFATHMRDWFWIAYIPKEDQ